MRKIMICNISHASVMTKISLISDLRNSRRIISKSDCKTPNERSTSFFTHSFLLLKYHCSCTSKSSVRFQNMDHSGHILSASTYSKRLFSDFPIRYKFVYIRYAKIEPFRIWCLWTDGIGSARWCRFFIQSTDVTVPTVEVNFAPSFALYAFGHLGFILV